MTPRPGRQAEFKRQFVQLDILGAAARTAGLRGELLRPRAGGIYIVTATWDTPEAYQAWRDSAVRQQIGVALEGFVTPSPAPELYEVLGVYSPDRGYGGR